MENIRLLIVGAGRWGMNHVKTAASILPHENITVCDFDPASESKIKSVSEKITFVNNIEDAKNITCAIVATPAETHFKIAKELLNNGIHCLVEKPITLNLEDAEELNKIAEEKKLKLMVGHVLLFHPAVKKMKGDIEKGRIGKLQYIYSNRLNLGAIRSEENILWSFAPHDVSVIQYLVGENPIEITAKGADFVQNGIEDTTITYLKYPNGVNAHIFVSWLHPFKEQRMVVIGEKGMFVFEDSLKSEKLKFYKKGFKNVEGKIEKFEQDYEVVEFEEKQPLKEEQLHFYNSINSNIEPLTDGKHAYEVLKILVNATNKLKINL
ncbi:hypothetical protein APF79_03645 [bacterium BRH_c32]|nr:MAG: hypothetical protein APF79_03645 [bacterium BRH_c32]